jgi:hypothetical protein
MIRSTSLLVSLALFGSVLAKDDEKKDKVDAP